jgi:hypothetical protein
MLVKVGAGAAMIGIFVVVGAGADQLNQIRALAPAATALSVEGNVDATSFTGDGSNLSGLVSFTRTRVVNWEASQQASCDSLREAAATITTDGDHPGRILLGPGIYDCGADPIELQPHVALVGSGEGHTLIRGTVSGSDGLVQIASNNLIENLAVRNDLSAVGGSFSVAIGDNGTLASFDTVIRNVRAEAVGGTMSFGVRLDNTSLVTCSGGAGPCPRRLTNVLATGRDASDVNRGIMLGGSSYLTTLVNVVAEGVGGSSSIGLLLSATKVSVRNSVFVGSTNTVNTGSSEVTIAHSHLDGGPVSGDDITCFGAYDEAFLALDGGCMSGL